MQKYKEGDRVFVKETDGVDINKWGTVIARSPWGKNIVYGVCFDNFTCGHGILAIYEHLNRECPCYVSHWYVNQSEIVDDNLTYIESNSINWV